MGKRKRGLPETVVCRKNEELELEILDMGAEGEGIGRIQGYTLFVKDALPGDLVLVRVMKTKKRYGYARLLEILRPSPDRVEPVCPVARQCGGCQIQHCSYEKQLEWKMKKVADCITRIGDIPVGLPGCSRDSRPEGQPDPLLEMEPIIRMDEPFHYRNKAQFPVGYDKEGKLVAGFYAGRTHSIIPCTDCKIQDPCSRILLEEILAFMEEYGIEAYRETENSGLVRHILVRTGKRTGQVMVCLVINGDSIPHQEELIQRLCRILPAGKGSLDGEGRGRSPYISSICLNINRKQTNVILGDQVRCIFGQPYLEDYIGRIRYRISPLSFYQVNPEQTEKLYNTVLEYAGLQGKETVWDLYCGIGTISLFLAEKAAKVCGVEIVPQAIADARENARLNDIHNAEFFAGAAEQVVPEQYEKGKGSLQADVVILDPPRKGCDPRLLDTVVKMHPQKIVYVSCDPATLARDLKILAGRGYELQRIRACDMFGQSSHVETVCLLHRRDM